MLKTKARNGLTIYANMKLRNILKIFLNSNSSLKLYMKARNENENRGGGSVVSSPFSLNGG